MELEYVSDESDHDRSAFPIEAENQSSQPTTELERQMNDAVLRRQSEHILALTTLENRATTAGFSLANLNCMPDRQQSTFTAASGFTSVQHDGTVTRHSGHSSIQSAAEHTVSEGASIEHDTPHRRGRYEQRLRSKTEALNYAAQISSNSEAAAVGALAIPSDAASTKRNKARAAVSETDSLHSSANTPTHGNESVAKVTSTLQQYSEEEQTQLYNHHDTEDFNYIDDDGLMSPIEPGCDGSEVSVAQVRPEPAAVVGAIRVPGINSSADSVDPFLEYDDGYYSAGPGTTSTSASATTNAEQSISVTHALTTEDLEAQMRSTIISDSIQATCVSSDNMIADQDSSEKDDNDGPQNGTSAASSNGDDPAFKKARLLWMLLGVVGCVIIAAVCYIVIVVIAEAAGSDTSGINQVDDSSQPPVTSPPAVLELEPFHLDFLDWLKDNVVNPEALNVDNTAATFTTPQYNAFAWLANDSIKSADDIPLTNSAKVPLLLERYALACLYYSTVGDGWTVANNWLSERSICLWYGIACDPSSKVNIMNLELNNLQGHISEEIGHLVELRSLRVGSNAFNTSRTSFTKNDERIDRDHGSLRPGLPTTIGLMTNLDEILIARSGLGGTLPTEFGLLSARLRIVRLKGAYLVGSIPTELGNLQNLVDLDVTYNELSGTLPPELGQLSILNRFLVEDNELVGTIPIEYIMGWPSRMDRVRLEGNSFDADTMEATFCNSTFAFSAVEITFSCTISSCSCCTNC